MEMTFIKEFEDYKELVSHRIEEPNVFHSEREHWEFEFSNGLGASVIRGATTYGGREGLFELAVMEDGRVCYDTPITDDVMGWLPVEGVISILDKIRDLKKTDDGWE